MNLSEYQHNEPASINSKVIQFFLKLIGIKNQTKKQMLANRMNTNPAKPGQSLRRSCNVEESTQDNRKVWTVSPKAGKSDVMVLFLHGGAYMGNIMRLHWDYVKHLIQKTNAAVIVPDYPLAPADSYKETYDFIQKLYSGMQEKYPGKRILFIGDSAGGGLAFGFVQYLRNTNQKQPEQIILLSPWLDITMDNPELKIIDPKDTILNIEGLKIASQKYAKDLDRKEYRVSPLYGDYSGLCPISVFTGTHDILYADAIACKEKMKNHQTRLNYFEYPGMFHDWMMVTNLKESRDVMNKIVALVSNQGSGI